jgi:Subunit ChlI of Mg-chelatase
MLATARSAALVGVDALAVEVEVDVSAGLPAFTLVGLPDQAVSEARERVANHAICDSTKLIATDHSGPTGLQELGA